jgi:hypothetical protein
VPANMSGPVWLSAAIAFLLIAAAAIVGQRLVSLLGRRRPLEFSGLALPLSHVLMCGLMAWLLLDTAATDSRLSTVLAGGLGACAVGFGASAVRSYIWRGAGAASAREAICCAAMAAMIVLSRSTSDMSAPSAATTFAIQLTLLGCLLALASAGATAVRATRVLGAGSAVISHSGLVVAGAQAALAAANCYMLAVLLLGRLAGV